MTEVLHSSSSSSSPSISTPTPSSTLFSSHPAESYQGGDEGFSNLTGRDTEAEQEEEEEVNSRVREKRESDRREQLSLLALLVALFRKRFWVSCKSDRTDSGGGAMEISWPSDVQHVNHVTFDRFDGFLGLPVEFEPEVPRRAPSASATVFGVSTESMQLSYDTRGNSIPTILLLMQRHLYSQGGLQVEGIFRITAGNSQEEFVRNQLNRGVVPEGIDIHCLAGLIKAWFRELPRGILDPLSPEQVMQCQSEEDCDALVRLLPPTEAALLDWAINLMADVVQNEHLNKMNARNIAMVFAPNMTKMADPLTALMYAVQVMNFLRTLIEKTAREREDSSVEPNPKPHMDSNKDNGNQSSFLVHRENNSDNTEEANHETKRDFVSEDPDPGSGLETSLIIENNTDEDDDDDDDFVSYSTCTEESDESVLCETDPAQNQHCLNEFEDDSRGKLTTGQCSNDSQVMSELKDDSQNYKSKEVSNLSRINSVTERVEAWR